MSAPTSRPGLAGRLARLFGRPGPAADALAPAPSPAPVSLFPTPARAPRAAATVPADLVFYHLVASDGRFVQAGPDWLLLGEGKAAAMLLATTAALKGRMGLLLAPGLGAFAVWPAVPAGAAQGVRILPTDTVGVVRLRDPLAFDGFGFLARHVPQGDPPAAGGAAAPTLRFDAGGSTMDAAFGLAPLAADAVPAEARIAAGEFAAAAGCGLLAVLDRLRDGRLRPALAEAVLRLLPRADLAELGRRLLERPDELALLQGLLPGDAWLRTILPALRDWHETRAPVPPPGIVQSPASDEDLLRHSGAEANLPLGLVLTGLARSAVLPRRGACLLTTVRNEGPYLLDWLSYHQALGFEHSFVYSNENSDGSDALLELLAQHGAITWIRNARGPRLGPQVKAYAHALGMLPEILDYRWMAVLDLDEYLALDATMFASLGDFLALQETQPVDAIALSWLLFAALPGEAWHDQSSLQRFVRRDRDVNQHVKSLFRPQLFWNAQPHYPFAVLGAPFDYRSQGGAVHHHRDVHDRLPAFSAAPLATQAWINHYILRTADEALWKWARGRASWSDDGQRAWYLNFVCKTFLNLAQPERLVEDRRILACAPGHAGALSKLRALPGVAACEAAIKADFARQIARARADFLARAPAPDEPADVTYFRDILDMANQ